MINKIGNWVFGSFFRTIGRLLVFVLLGVIIASLVDFGDIFDNFRITDLFFEKVSADTLYNNRWFTYYNDTGRTSALPTSNNLYQYIQLTSTGTSINGQNVYFNEPIQKTKYYDYITIPYLITGSNSGEAAFDTMNYHCSILETQQNGQTVYIPYSCTYLNANSSQYMPVEVNFTFSITLITDGGGLTNCKLESDQIKCYLTSGYNYVGFTFYYSTTNMNNVVNPLRIHFQHVVGLQQDSSNAIVDKQQETTDAITNQTQQQQQQHEEMMDSNTTEAEDEAGDFLGNFTVEDTGGLNAIITAPLATIQSLLNNTCNKLVLPLPFVDKNIELPCLYPIYNDYFGAFFTIYQTIILGIISYRCIKSLFFDVKGFTNPEDDRIEVMDL